MNGTQLMNGKLPLPKVDLGPESSKLHDWGFNVFSVDKHTGGHALYHLVMSLLEHHGLFDDWYLDRRTMGNYLLLVESTYKTNPYHNSVHAADVAQTSNVIFTSADAILSMPSSSSSSHYCQTCGTIADSSSSAAAAGAAGAAGLTKPEKFSIIFSSAIHDLAHPGVNNAFLVKTRDTQAVIYNDRSVNENMHASMAFQLAASSPEVNIFANFPPKVYELVRKLVVDMVLSTDMDVHFKLLEQFSKALLAEPDLRKWGPLEQRLEQRSLLFQMIVHLADLANPSRPWPLALKWAEQVVTEFFGQGVKEAAAQLPVSPFCDSSKVCMPAAQLGFIDAFMAPTLQMMRPAAPSFYHMASGWLADTQRKWRLFKEAGVMHPHHGYPQLPAATPAEQAKLWTALGEGCRCCSACTSNPAQQQHQCKGSEQQQQVDAQQQQQAAQAAG